MFFPMMSFRRMQFQLHKYRRGLYVLYVISAVMLLFPFPHKKDIHKDVACLSDEECFESAQCNDLVFTGHDWYFCNETINFDDCIVYSVGISLEWSFDNFMGKLGCEVHSFDPTVDLSKIDMGKNIHFHKWGIGSFNMGSYSQKQEGSEILPMSEILRRLGHENKKISILKMDCEGKQNKLQI